MKNIYKDIAMKKNIFYLVFAFMLFLVSYGCEEKRNRDAWIRYDDSDLYSYFGVDNVPAWSPDGQWISFYHKDNEPGKRGIYLISFDGKEIRKWHDTPNDLMSGEITTWSPDGQWIAFTERSQIWKKKIDGDSLMQLTFEGFNRHPSWSPDGKRIVYSKDTMSCYGIYTMNVDGQEKEVFRYEPQEYMEMPSWIDDSTIVYVRKSSLFLYTEIYSTERNGKNEKRLTFNNVVDTYPKSSNKRIAFSSRASDKIALTIWTMSVRGLNYKQLTHNPAFACDWSPDGKYIVYTDTRVDNRRIWIMDSSGNNKRQLTFDYHFNDF